ncbi:aldehyde dehydrogenase [Tenuibacillus multivorans]|uniref:Aldehyde dehydrogenase n=1 Tax=Tenuibacillus multivorans TaxID=237069 RepID=A0A1H0D362_9BACI|nr:aldehyde dehydrogenase [Tenuibacillus multivorans]GEL76068.1 aldehyde dehydrogenase [Tenuibacillus multivorans]SDN64321.1 aldehyde dehydrogenase (NAD+) [Tenuibacillus multivorans]
MSEIQEIVQHQKSLFRAGKTMTYTYRIHQLQKLKQMLERYEPRIYESLHKDLNKSSYEVLTTELGYLQQEINYAIKHLREWMQPKKVKTPTSHKGAKSLIYKQPYGVVLIISPWNYPLHLAIAPLIGAIAAGNTAVIKPSELTPYTSELIEEMIEETFEKKYLTVIQGDQEISQALLDQPFDYIFFTGSVPVGKIVMEKASQQLIPVTLELGGKSPCIVDHDAKLEYAARRIVWGKFLNAGQTCVAPDYLLVHQNVKEKLVQHLQKEIEKMYSPNPMESDEFTKIVNERHFDRLMAYLEEGNILYGGKSDRDNRLMNPTLMDAVDWDSKMMKDEIFGPILPILTYQELEEVYDHIEHSRNPLALYYFSENERKQEWITRNISFGGGCINDTVMHLGTNQLPFGGIGSSGIGKYHGKYSFDTFTHEKSVLKQTTAFDLAFRYPNSKVGRKILKKLFK